MSCRSSDSPNSCVEQEGSVATSRSGSKHRFHGRFDPSLRILWSCPCSGWRRDSIKLVGDHYHPTIAAVVSSGTSLIPILLGSEVRSLHWRNEHIACLCTGDSGLILFLKMDLENSRKWLGVWAKWRKEAWSLCQDFWVDMLFLTLLT
jgi:hypothetical protein